jgi:methionyl aminopeptidase
MIEKMRAAGKLASNTLEYISNHVVAGVSLKALDQLCEQYVLANSGIAALKGYRGYPSTTCISVGHVVCHGIPTDRVLKEGDIVSIDVTVEVNGWYGDTCRTFSVGKPSIKNKRLMDSAEKAMWEGIKKVKPGAHSSEIGKAIQAYAKMLNLQVIKEYCGHGIGNKIHMGPNILNYYDPTVGVVLQPGMYITVEPIITTGNGKNLLLGDGWTVVTKDKQPCAQFEHTVAVTESGYEVLTIPD